MTTNGHTDSADMMSAEQFASYMEKRLTLAEEIELLNREDMIVRLKVRGEPVEVDLSNFYDAYKLNPGQLDAVAHTFARVLLGELPERSETDYNQLADRIFPMLKKVDILIPVRERNLPMLAYRDFLADLIITYVIDEQHSVAYVNEQHLERWDVTLQDLHEQAIENLRRRTTQVEGVSAGQGEQRLYIFNTGDGYDATRLLLTDILEGWRKSFRGQLVIGIPNRDFLIAFSDRDMGIVRNIAIQVQSDAAQREHGLTDQLFTLSGGQVREYEWE